MSSIVWLASYPKSGNTWVRAFLTNYLRNADTPADINSLDTGPIASSRETFDEVSGLEASDLTQREIERFRPDVYRTMAARTTEPIFMKTHDAWTLGQDGHPIVGPPDTTRAVVYLIRNPLDVAVSYANHAGRTVDRTIDVMIAEDTVMASRPGHLSRQLRQVLRSWSGHVRSWVDESGLPVSLIRYEDLIKQPLEGFTTIVQAGGLEYDPERVARAIRFSRFEVLRGQEEKVPFRERTTHAERFFRKGVVGDWRGQLSEEQVNRITAAHGETMRKYGYLEAAGEVPVPPNAGPRRERGSAQTAH